MATFLVGAFFGGVCAFLVGVVVAQFLPADVQSRIRAAFGLVPARQRDSGGGVAITHFELAELRRDNPAVAQILEAAPAVEPETVPAFVDASQVADGRLPPIANPDLDRLLRGLLGWRPRSTTYGDEQGFGNSMVWHLTNRSAFERSAFDEKPAIDLVLNDEKKRARPDYVFWGRLLVEIKGDIEHGATSDRALGQMFRYLLAWKGRGPALLMVCGDCDPVYKLVIRQYVDTWRDRFRMPISVFFASHEAASAVVRELPTGNDA